MPRQKPTPDDILAALQAESAETAPPRIWLVMQFGVGTRPNVACSDDFQLASAHFLEVMRTIAALFPKAEYSMRAIDGDMALNGLSLYQDGRLALTLQPAGAIVPHVGHARTSCFNEDPDFSLLALCLLAGLSKRSGLSDAERAIYRHSMVARSWEDDLDDAASTGLITETEAAERVPPDVAETGWGLIQNAHTLLAYQGTVAADPGDEEDNEEDNEEELWLDIDEALVFARSSERMPLPTAFDPDTGTPSSWREGCFVSLRPASKHAADTLEYYEEEEIDPIHEIIEAVGGDLSRISLEDRSRILLDLELTINACPYAIDAYILLSAIAVHMREYQTAFDVVASVVDQLLALLPPEGEYVQVPYYELGNRPFHRLMHSYVVALHNLGRHREASAAAKRMLKLWPSDNLGFRFLTSRAARRQAGI